MDHERLVIASRAFLRSRYDSSAVVRYLAELGSSANVDRAYVFENETMASGEVLTSQRFEWNSGAAEAQIDNPELQGLSMTELLPAWLEAFDRGDVYFGIVAELPAAEQEILVPQDIQSIFVCPIRVAEEVWGFVGFDDCQRPRRWKVEERLTLSQASTALAAALRHRDLKKRLSAARTALERTVDSGRS
ncbi:MAG: GAF domain-containing protein [Sandaracinaceae bacterium]